MRGVLLVILTFLCGSAPLLYSNDAALAADELAFHLGVAAWTTAFPKQNGDFSFEVLQVENGKAGAKLVGTTVYVTDREFTKVAILASEIPSATKLSISAAGSPAMRCKTSGISLEIRYPLPGALTEGEYILGGKLRDNSDGNPTVENLQSGLLLRIVRASAPSS